MSPGFCLGIAVDLLTKVVEMTADYMRRKEDEKFGDAFARYASETK